VTATRRWSYTYNRYGQELTATDPRGKTTTKEYWADTVFEGEAGHWLGDLKSQTNALGHKTQYTQYNKRGQVLTTVLPNAATEVREYHVRGWLTKVTLQPAAGAAQTTQYEYDATGQLKVLRLADGSTTTYTYDAAHRLTDVTDAAGNTVHYTLDDAGNRTGEDYKDPSGALARQITRSYDALNRVQSTTGVQ